MVNQRKSSQTYLITGTGITESSFDFLSAPPAAMGPISRRSTCRTRLLVPEPDALSVLAIGLTGLGFAAWRRKMRG